MTEDFEMAGPSGGETQKDPSGFTTDTLHALMSARFEHVDRVIAEMDRRYEQRFVAQEQAVGLALTRVDKEFHEHLQQVREETRAALSAAEKAIEKAEAATEKRFESVNEFRAQLSDQASRFMPRLESLQRHDATGEKIDALDARYREQLSRINQRLDTETGASAGQDKTRALIAWGIAAVAGLISIVIAANAYFGK